MKRKTEKAYFNELWDQMTFRLHEFMRTGDQEQLHQFRLQVKKLGALLTLLDAAMLRSKLIRIFKPVKKIFKQGGKIREAYINLQLSAHYELNNDEFILYQVNEIEQGIIDFRQNEKKYLKTLKTLHDELENDLEAVDDGRIKEFYKDQLEQIAMALAENSFNDDLHDCRKRIKILFYNRKIASAALNGSLYLDVDYLDKLQGHIGDWHDTILAIELFSAPEIKAKPVIAKIKRQNTRLRKSINELAVDFWKKATMADKATDDAQAGSIWV